MSGEFHIGDMGDCVWLERYPNGDIEIKIGDAPLLVVSETQARNLAKAFEMMLPGKVSVNATGYGFLGGYNK